MPSAAQRAAANKQDQQPKATSTDLEAKLKELRELTQKMAADKKEYELLRDELTEILDEPQAFVDHEGNKLWAARKQSTTVVFDVDLLAELVDDETFEEIIEVSVNREAFRAACAAERITPAVIAKVARTKENKASVNFTTKRVSGDASTTSFKEDDTED